MNVKKMTKKYDFQLQWVSSIKQLQERSKKLQAYQKGVIISTNFTRRPIQKQFVTGQMKKNTPMQTMRRIFMLNLESLGCRWFYFASRAKAKAGDFAANVHWGYSQASLLSKLLSATPNAWTAHNGNLKSIVKTSSATRPNCMTM